MTINSIRGLLGVRRMGRVTNARIRVSCGVSKVVDDRIDASVGSAILKEY